jgi:hypothetical protein
MITKTGGDYMEAALLVNSIWAKTPFIPPTALAMA